MAVSDHVGSTPFLDAQEYTELTTAGFLLLAMLALSMFPLIKNNLGGDPVVQAKMVRGLLIPLAIADVSYRPRHV